MVGFEDETWLHLRPYITNTYMMEGYQQKIFYKGSNAKVNAFITFTLSFKQGQIQNKQIQNKQ